MEEILGESMQSGFGNVNVTHVSILSYGQASWVGGLPAQSFVAVSGRRQECNWKTAKLAASSADSPTDYVVWVGEPD